MTYEIERKWRVRKPPIPLPAGKAIRQGYLAVGGQEVRIRQKGDAYRLTVKQGRGLIRQEHEIALTEAQFESLWPATDGRRVEKTRCKMAHEGRTVELDVYGGALEGLMVAEVEFPERGAADAFAPPLWFDEELTEVSGWSNAELAQHGMPMATDDTQRMRDEDLPRPEET